MDLLTLHNFVQEQKENIVNEMYNIEYRFDADSRRYFIFINDSEDDSEIATMFNLSSVDEYWRVLRVYTSGCEVTLIDSYPEASSIMTYDSKMTLQLAIKFLREWLYRDMVYRAPELRKRVHGVS